MSRCRRSLLMEAGSCLTHLLPRPLPAGVDAESQGLWGSIGWATPACLGVAMAKASGRTWLVTGDGAHQLTLNELALMGCYGVKPVLFAPKALGCKDWLNVKVATVRALEEVLAHIDHVDGAVYMEVPYGCVLQAEYTRR